MNLFFSFRIFHILYYINISVKYIFVVVKYQDLYRRKTSYEHMIKMITKILFCVYMCEMYITTDT
mgnify:FL=1